MELSWEEHSLAGRPEDMVYSYEEARAREAELLRSAQRTTVVSVPRREGRRTFGVSRILQLVRGRSEGVRKPAVSGT